MDVILVLLAVVLAFYFILLRPVIKQQRQRRDDISSLRVGDEVLTSGGFYAVVRDIRTTDSGPMELDLEAAPNVVLRAAPHAIEQVVRRAPGESPTETSSGTSRATEGADLEEAPADREPTRRGLRR